MVSVSAYAIRIRICDQSSGAACFDRQVGREIKNRNEDRTLILDDQLFGVEL